MGWALIVELVAGPMVANREQAIVDLAEALDASPMPAPEERGTLTRVDRERAAAMMALAGGPALPRAKPEPSDD